MSKEKLGTGARFKSLSHKLEKKGIRDPDALAYVIGRKKYGSKKMTAMSKKGKTRHEK